MEVVLIGLALAVVVLFFWLRRGRTVPEAPVEPGRVWTYRDEHPEPSGRNPRIPDYVDHELDFETMRYRSVETYTNDEISAESDTSIATEHFATRRDEEGSWQIKLISRNHSPIEGREWQAAPPAYARQWEEAWRRRDS